MQQIVKTTHTSALQSHNKPLVCYSILYHKNPCYQVNSLTNVVTHEALLFKKFENTTQQANLFLEYSSLPIILSDMAISVLQNRVRSIQDYPKAANYRLLANEKENTFLYEHVLKKMLLRFFVSDMPKKKIWKGETEWQRIFHYKQLHSEIQFYPSLIFENLANELYQNTSLFINSSKSKITKQTIKLHLEFTIDISRLSFI